MIVSHESVIIFSPFTPKGLEIMDTTNDPTCASYLDLHLEFDNGERLQTTLYDKRYDFNIQIVNFPFVGSNISD